MSFIESAILIMDGVRERTLATCSTIEETGRSSEVLGWRPGAGRAHVAWQLMHIGITEDLFGTERLKSTPCQFPNLKDRFRGGSQPDEDIPSLDEIRSVLDQSRSRLLETLRSFTEDDLAVIPEGLKERGWTLEKAIQILIWHEAHHQGQAHLTLNLWNAANGN